jgi:hypothetical protein
MRRLFRRYTQLTVSQKRIYSLLTVITVFALLMYCLGIGSLLIRSQLVPEVAVQIPSTSSPSATHTSVTIVTPEHTYTPTATLPATPTQRPIPTYTPTPTITPTLEIITMTVLVTSTPGVVATEVISVTVTPTPVITPTVTVTTEASLTTPPLPHHAARSAPRPSSEPGAGRCCPVASLWEDLAPARQPAIGPPSSLAPRTLGLAA